MITHHPECTCLKCQEQKSIIWHIALASAMIFALAVAYSAYQMIHNHYDTQHKSAYSDSIQHQDSTR
jgi:hypothetical protein